MNRYNHSGRFAAELGPGIRKEFGYLIGVDFRDDLSEGENLSRLLLG